MVEKVEYLSEARNRRASPQWYPLLHSHLYAMDRLADEGLTRDDRAVQPHAIDARDLQPASVAAADHLRALTGPVEVNATELEALPDFPDAVEDQTMPLIAFGQ